MIKISMQLPKLDHQDGALWARVLPRFQAEAGALVVEHVRAQLGQDETYSLTDAYAKRKRAGKTKPKMKRYANMSVDEQLVLGGGMYEGVTAEISGSILKVSVAPGAGISPTGFDYAQEWEDKVGFLEKGFQEVERILPDLLERIIVEEMMLDL